MKLCSKCNTEKDEALFPRYRQSKIGIAPHCKECAKQRMQAWRAANPERHATHLANRDKEKLRAAHARWRDKNLERERARVAAWSKANPERAAVNAATRRAAKKRAIPNWANRFFISEAYHIARIRSEVLGVTHVVDHIVPLQSPTVCGLHVEHNLQVIPETMNAQKGNHWWPNMPEAV